MLTGKAKEDFEVWFNEVYKHNYTFYQSKENEKIIMTIIVDWFCHTRAFSIGGHSISDIIYKNMQTGINIFPSIRIAIKTANENYNEINK